jgi:hypothetical protein
MEVPARLTGLPQLGVLAHAVAGAADVDQVAVMHQPLDVCGGPRLSQRLKQLDHGAVVDVARCQVGVTLFRN